MFFRRRQWDIRIGVERARRGAVIVIAVVVFFVVPDSGLPWGSLVELLA